MDHLHVPLTPNASCEVISLQRSTAPKSFKPRLAPVIFVNRCSRLADAHRTGPQNIGQRVGLGVDSAYSVAPLLTSDAFLVVRLPGFRGPAFEKYGRPSSHCADESPR